MKIAFASTDGKMINRAFGEATEFRVWEIGPDRADYHDERYAITANPVKEERIIARASAVADCAIVCSLDISTIALARIVAQNAFHLRTGTEKPIEEIIKKLQGILQGNPPPWLKKAMTNRFESAASA